MKHNLVISIGGVILTIVMGYYGCDKLTPIGSDMLETDVFKNAGNQNPDANGQQPTGNVTNTNQSSNASGAPRSAILIGTFNIRMFGVSKMSEPDAMQTLVDIVRRFDVMAIQELRAVDQSIVPEFVKMINANGSQFEYRVGPRQGYTSSKEQYVYIWNARTIRLIQENWIAPDPQGDFHRAPMIASFECLTDTSTNPFRFSLANIHTDPDVATEEVNALAGVFQKLQGSNYVDDDLIVLGDFNASPKQFGRLAAVPGIAAVIPSTYPTNLAGTACYDNIVFDRRFTTEFSGQAGVFDFQKSYGLSRDQAKRVSDHFPVWAVFSTSESNANTNLATQGAPAFSR